MMEISRRRSLEEASPEELKRCNEHAAWAKEDCRRREIDRYLAIKQFHEASQSRVESEQKEQEAYADQIQLKADLDRFDSGPAGQTMQDYRYWHHLGRQGQELKQAAETSQNQVEMAKQELAKLSQLSNQNRQALKQLEPAWKKNPLQKLGLVRASTKERRHQQWETSYQKLASSEFQQQTKAQEISNLNQELETIQANPLFDNLPEAISKLTELKPGYSEAKVERSRLVAASQAANEQWQAAQKEAAIDRQQVEQASETAEQIYQEIQDFFNSETISSDDLISSRTRRSYLAYHDDQPTFPGRSWRGPNDETSADQYRHNQAAAARGLDPATMTRRPGASPPTNPQTLAA